MEGVCDRILELDSGRCYMHDFGGQGSYERFKQVGGGCVECTGRSAGRLCVH
jgi:hypothetical protein